MQTMPADGGLSKCETLTVQSVGLRGALEQGEMGQQCALNDLLAEQGTELSAAAEHNS